jgi:cob(I)alamin adenosyltransferase
VQGADKMRKLKNPDDKKTWLNSSVPQSLKSRVMETKAMLNLDDLNTVAIELWTWWIHKNDRTSIIREKENQILKLQKEVASIKNENEVIKSKENLQVIEVFNKKLQDFRKERNPTIPGKSYVEALIKWVRANSRYKGYNESLQFIEGHINQPGYIKSDNVLERFNMILDELKSQTEGDS